VYSPLLVAISLHRKVFLLLVCVGDAVVEVCFLDLPEDVDVASQLLHDLNEVRVNVGRRRTTTRHLNCGHQQLHTDDQLHTDAPHVGILYSKHTHTHTHTLNCAH